MWLTSNGVIGVGEVLILIVMPVSSMCCIRDVGRNVGTYVETSITMTRAGVMTLTGIVPNTWSHRSHVCGN